MVAMATASVMPTAVFVVVMVPIVVRTVIVLGTARTDVDSRAVISGTGAVVGVVGTIIVGISGADIEANIYPCLFHQYSWIGRVCHESGCVESEE